MSLVSRSKDSRRQQCPDYVYFALRSLHSHCRALYQSPNLFTNFWHMSEDTYRWSRPAVCLQLFAAWGGTRGGFLSDLFFNYSQSQYSCLCFHM